jgi:hypothetical protein
VIALAASDQKVTKEEARNTRARWEELKSVTEGFVHAAEKGNFSELERELQSKALH